MKSVRREEMNFRGAKKEYREGVKEGGKNGERRIQKMKHR